MHQSDFSLICHTREVTRWWLLSRHEVNDLVSRDCRNPCSAATPPNLNRKNDRVGVAVPGVASFAALKVAVDFTDHANLCQQNHGFVLLGGEHSQDRVLAAAHVLSKPCSRIISLAAPLGSRPPTLS